MAAAELRPMTTAGHMGMTPDAIYAVPDEVITNIMADRIARCAPVVIRHWQRLAICHLNA